MLAPMQELTMLGYRFYRLLWRAGDAKATLRIAALDPEMRGSIAETINILAVHPARPGLLAPLTA
jgi:hypothetical protein